MNPGVPSLNVPLAAGLIRDRMAVLKLFGDSVFVISLKPNESS